MADYYTLIRRAIERGDSRTGEARRGVYEKARGALVRQLRSLDPPLSESEITRQRLALEDAIRKVEAEMAEALVRGAATALGRLEEPKPAAPAAPPAAAPKPPGLPPLPPRPVVPPPKLSPIKAPPAPPPARELDKDPVAPAPAPTPPPPAPDPAPSRAPPVLARTNPLKDLAGKPPRPAEPEPSRRQEAAPRATEPDEVAPEEADHAGETAEEEHRDAPLHPAYAASASPVSGRLIAIAAGAALLFAGGLAIWQRDALVRLLEPGAEDVAQAPQQATPPSRSGSDAQPSGKIEDRVPQAGDAPAVPRQPAQQPSTTAGAGAGATGEATISVAQKAILYEEEGGEAGKGQFYNGTVSWRAEPDDSAPPALLVRGLIDIPERNLKLLMTLRRNSDPNFPASHTIELLFEVPSNFPPGSVQNVPGVLLKERDEPSRGTALAAASARVTNGFFLIGLSAAEQDRTRNLELLRSRSWIDVPMLYTNNRRAILTIEKGAPGERAIAQALQSWTQ